MYMGMLMYMYIACCIKYVRVIDMYMCAFRTAWMVCSRPRDSKARMPTTAPTTATCEERFGAGMVQGSGFLLRDSI